MHARWDIFRFVPGSFAVTPATYALHTAARVLPRSFTYARWFGWFLRVIYLLFCRVVPVTALPVAFGFACGYVTGYVLPVAVLRIVLILRITGFTVTPVALRSATIRSACVRLRCAWFLPIYGWITDVYARLWFVYV